MNTLVITPIRVIFLIVLIGTTLEVLTERTRLSWRHHPMEVEDDWSYGRGRIRNKGPQRADDSLREAGVAAASIVVVDNVLEVAAEANRAGYAAVTGDATRRDVLASARDARQRPGWSSRSTGTTPRSSSR